MTTTNWLVHRFTAGKWEEIPDVIISEVPLSIYLDGTFLITLYCTPLNMELLVLGYLFHTGHLASASDVATLFLDPEKREAHVKLCFEKPALFPGVVPPSEPPRILPVTVLYLAEILGQNRLFRETGAVHCGIIARREKILFAAEDTGRFNVLDKITGYILKEGVSTADLILAFSGRLTRGVVERIARIGLRAVVSPAAPTSGGLEIASAEGITAIGFSREKRFNVYTHEERIST